MSYTEFLQTKDREFTHSGFDCASVGININDRAMPFQSDIVHHALRLGKYCLWADTGMGKGFMLLAWADAVHRHTQRDVIVLAPLGVARQLVREAEKFNIQSPVKYCKEHADIEAGITVTNYERLSSFDPLHFIGVVLDESSILKNSTGAICTAIIEAFASTPYKLACSATPSPNDYTELGTQCEFLGVMSKVEMLASFFTHDGGDTSKWVLKGHAKKRFWEWVAKWGIVLRKPSDLGYSDDGYSLPPLNCIDVEIATPVPTPDGVLFRFEAKSLSEQRELNKLTLNDRINAAAAIVNDSDEQFVVWCETNIESEMLRKAIPGSAEVTGSDSPDLKEDTFAAFSSGELRVLITKAKIAGMGMNWQQCHNTVFVCASHSFERTYQSIRRFYRYGQESEVNAYFIRHQLESAVQRNYVTKEDKSKAMYEGIVGIMMDVIKGEITGLKRMQDDYKPSDIMVTPSWLKTEYDDDCDDF
jgi:superfamily II DNA or RNA helicase